MARKKNAKLTAARKKAAAASAQPSEKDFFNTPAKLAAQFNKEIATLKQTESKVKATIAKLQIQAQKATSRAKATAATKNLKTLTKQLQEITKNLTAAIQKQAKMTALRKSLIQFEKEWAKKLKTMKAAKGAVKSKPKKTVSKKSKASAAEIIPLQQPQVETFETSMDNVKEEKASEAIS